MLEESPIFELIEERFGETVPDVLGLWKIRPLPSSEMMAFDATQGGTSQNFPATPVWRVNLPVNVDRAVAYLDLGKAQLEKSQRLMQQAPQRLHSLAKVQKKSYSFDVSSEKTSLTDPEQEFVTSLYSLQPDTLSFGLKEQISGKWQQSTEQFQAFMDQLLKAFVQYICVETYVQNNCLGRSCVSWTGDLRTTWRQNLSKDHMKLHQKALELALASRNSMMQSFVLAVSVAVQLAALVASPGSAVLLMPRVWKYIQQIVSHENS